MTRISRIARIRHDQPIREIREIREIRGSSFELPWEDDSNGTPLLCFSVTCSKPVFPGVQSGDVEDDFAMDMAALAEFLRLPGFTQG